MWFKSYGKCTYIYLEKKNQLEILYNYDLNVLTQSIKTIVIKKHVNLWGLLLFLYKSLHA